MRRALAAVITIVIAAGILWTGLLRDGRSGSGRVESDLSRGDASDVRSERSNANAGIDAGSLSAAADRIEVLLECAQRGDVEGYLKSFCGAVRARLDRQVEERGRDAFAADLRRFGRLKKSHAVFAAEPVPAGAAIATARVTVETTFADRIERQTYRLMQCDAGWLVSEVERARDQVPKNAVGSWATFREPEGVPVPLRDEG
jgi:hypothetical protein